MEEKIMHLIEACEKLKVQSNLTVKEPSEGPELDKLLHALQSTEDTLQSTEEELEVDARLYLIFNV